MDAPTCTHGCALDRDHRGNYGITRSCPHHYACITAVYDCAADVSTLADILAKLDASAHQRGAENPIHARTNRRKREGLDAEE